MSILSSTDLTSSEERRVSEFLSALRSPCDVEKNIKSDLVYDDF
jgi:hypothetical protein